MAIVDRKLAIGFLSAIAGGFALSRFLNYHPRPVQSEECRNCPDAPALSLARPIKAITYNAQFFAGTNYHFFYDGGRDTLVDPDDVRKTVAAISAFVAQENPDFVLLQEVDCGAKRTGYVDQIELLLNSLPTDLRNYVATPYWKSRFVPHPKVMGSADTRLAIFSRYRLERATRYRLPHTPGNPIANDFNFKHAILEVEIPSTNGETFVLLNTHLEAFPKGTDIMQRQVDYVLTRLDSLDQMGIPWTIGGDFNLLPPGQGSLLNAEEKGCHREPSEISSIYERYHGVPLVSDASEKEMRNFMTFTKRMGGERVPIRTLDYFFASPKVEIKGYAVRQEGMRRLSDHLPLVAEFIVAG
jgi:endonuclease/exonuclease/phosphatase family metal-dependent hydrolase